eukprot:snap_masked-scaffold_22-processed-gene-2.33-mRNA-1 protein AED:0.03 eAED:0.03 QI:0/0/0/0.5/1/1/2/0/221
MKLKQLEIELSKVKTFENPKVELEQYPTSAHLASRTLISADSFGDIYGKRVLDLGCGTGMLSIAAALLEASFVLGVDVDEDALHQALENSIEVESDVEYLKANILKGLDLKSRFETVIMNPPFGTKKQKNADFEFLKVGLSYADVIYSMHKSSTRKFFQKKAKELGYSFQVVAEVKFDVKNMYTFHKKQSKDIAVDVLRFSKLQNKNSTTKYEHLQRTLFI